MTDVSNPIKNGAVSSVIAEPKDTFGVIGDSYVISYATVADDLPAWGTQTRTRDTFLRNFWPSEPLLASAIFSTVSKYVSFGWSLEGPARTTKIYQEMLQGVERGQGWMNMMTKFLIDALTQDNGAFLEVVRAEPNNPAAPVVTLNHLDSALCYRTGRALEPVIYQDEYGILHKLKYYEVIAYSEFPSPNTYMRGMQYCAVTRLLRAAQIMRDISVYKREKISGRFVRAVHLVGGVQRKPIEDAFRIQTERADNSGLTRYIQPIIVAALDPTATVSHETIELAALPDSFDEELYMKWYITQLAMALGEDYQELAPLPAGNLGTSQQSQILHMKSRGKGPALFMRNMEYLFNYHGILPNTVKMTYGEQDILQDVEKANLRKARAESRRVMIESGEITPFVARQIALEEGDLTEAHLAMMNERDVTTDTIVTSSVPAASLPGAELDGSQSEISRLNDASKPVVNDKRVGETTGKNNGTDSARGNNNS